MSDNTSENILFREIENLEDSELQSKLYENIYYEQHNTESTTINSLMTIQFDSMTNKLNTEQDVMQAATNSASQFLEPTSTSKLPNQETTNPVIQDHVNTDDNDRYAGSVLATEKKKNNRSSSQEHKLNCSTDEDSDSLEVYSKYNVLQKQEKKKKLIKKKMDKEMADKSDSDDSIFEVPVPPKPKPLVINLQDSDEEDNLNLRTSKNDTIRSDENSKTITHMPNNITLNCSPVHSPIQTGASSINEIRHLSKSANIEKNLQDKLSKNKNQNTNKNLPHDKTTKNKINCCLKGNTLIAKQTSPSIDKSSNRCNMSNLRLADQNELCNTSLEESCTNSPVTNRKRHLVNKSDESSKEKRRYSSHHIIPQDNSNIVRRKESWDDYIFKPMTDEMKAYYNSTQSHQNFDVAELQRNMSNDPRKWGILDEDLMPRPSSKKQHTRFWNVRCGNCRENGHMRYDCATPRRAINCYICGEKGHNESRCSKKSCLTCGKKQNTFCQTCEKCRVLYCTMCNSTGHLRKHCPDLWRRYHQTTTMSSVLQDPGNVMKPPSQLHCCNCAKCGHESSTCKEYRWSQHFPTPAAVTSYTCGPRYRLDDTSTSNSGQFAQKANVSLSSEIENRLVPHDSMDMQHSECSTNARVLPVSTNELIYEEEAMFLPEEDRTVASFTVHNKTNKTNTLRKVDFYHVIYYYGKLRNKNNRNVQIMLKNLSDLIIAAGTSIYAKKTISSLAKGKVAPDFFKALTDKKIELEVTIGFQTQENNDLTLQIVAIKENLQEIYNLFLYWIHLPNDEKKYGINVCLPTNLKKMYNVMSGRRMQIEKQKFKSYKESVETRAHDLLYLIKDVKKQLTQHNTKKGNRRLRTKLWHLQIRLLMIVNTEPKANDHIRKYYEILNKLEKLKGKAFNVQRDSVLFLQLTLLYNHLFVPHTPINAEQTIYRIMKEAERATGEQVTTNTSQIEQVCNQSIQPFYADVALPSESSTFHMPQNNFIESFSMFNAHQTAPDVSFLRDDINVGLSTNSDSINHTYDDEVVITYVNDQPKNLQFTIPKIQAKQTKNERKKRKKERIALKISDSVLISNLINKARAFKLPYMLQAADKLEKRKKNGTLRTHHVNALTKLIVLETKHQKQVSNCKSLIGSL